MKKKFSTAWKASKQPRKQRKYVANAPLHLRKKFFSVNLSKVLREKYGKRNVVLRKGDTVKIMRGKFAKKTGKVTEIKMKLGKIYIEKITAKKKDGSSVNTPIRASNLQIIELVLDDAKRAKKLGAKVETKKEDKETTKKVNQKEKVEKTEEKIK